MINRFDRSIDRSFVRSLLLFIALGQSSKDFPSSTWKQHQDNLKLPGGSDRHALSWATTGKRKKLDLPVPVKNLLYEVTKTCGKSVISSLFLFSFFFQGGSLTSQLSEWKHQTVSTRGGQKGLPRIVISRQITHNNKQQRNN